MIDSDPVMNKILQKPMIAMNVLLNIYNYRKGSGRLNELKGTKLYNLFMSNWFQQSLKVSSTLPSYANRFFSNSLEKTKCVWKKVTVPSA